MPESSGRGVHSIVNDEEPLPQTRDRHFLPTHQHMGQAAQKVTSYQAGTDCYHGTKEDSDHLLKAMEADRQNLRSLALIIGN